MFYIELEWPENRKSPFKKQPIYYIYWPLWPTYISSSSSSSPSFASSSSSSYSSSPFPLPLWYFPFFLPSLSLLSTIKVSLKLLKFRLCRKCESFLVNTILKDSQYQDELISKIWDHLDEILNQWRLKDSTSHYFLRWIVGMYNYCIKRVYERIYISDA